MKVKITKIEVNPESVFKAAKTVDEYRESLDIGDELSPNVGYYIEGEIPCRPIEGQSLTCARESRNGVKMFGIFQTSPVKKVEGKYEEGFYECVFTTENSVYLLEEII